MVCTIISKETYSHLYFTEGCTSLPLEAMWLGPIASQWWSVPVFLRKPITANVLQRVLKPHFRSNVTGSYCFSMVVCTSISKEPYSHLCFTEGHTSLPLEAMWLGPIASQGWSVSVFAKETYSHLFLQRILQASL